MRTARTNLTYLAAAVTVLLGLLALLNPSLVARLSGLATLEPRGLSTVRATYGAMYLVLGGVMMWAVPNRPRSFPWLRFAALLWLGTAAGRLASVILDGAWSFMNVAILLLELAIGAATAWGSFERPGHANPGARAVRTSRSDPAFEDREDRERGGEGLDEGSARSQRS